MKFNASDVSAIVCTWNSAASIERCLESLRLAGVGELIVVDAGSTDGTREMAVRFADLVLLDTGDGLGAARSIGIGKSTKPLILNMGSDNVLPPDQLQRMLDDLEQLDVHGVSAQTKIEGTTYLARGLNAWRSARFRPGPAKVIGTPSLFRGDELRSSPYDASRRFSDDSELCERWADQFDAEFAINDGFVLEVGKASWSEIIIRCRMYGVSDYEVYRRGSASGWTRKRKGQSLLHPLRADLIQPIAALPMRDAARYLPFLGTFVSLRYIYWLRAAIERNQSSPFPPTTPTTPRSNP